MDLKILREWTINFVKNKDLIARKIVNYEDYSEFVLFHFKDKDVKYFFNNLLDDSIFSISKEGFVVFVCVANKSNLNFLINNWVKLKDFEKISFLFVQTNNNEKWIINPYVHSKICDESTIKTGLKSMYNNGFGSS